MPPPMHLSSETTMLVHTPGRRFLWVHCQSSSPQKKFKCVVINGRIDAATTVIKVMHLCTVLHMISLTCTVEADAASESDFCGLSQHKICLHSQTYCVNRYMKLTFERHIYTNTADLVSKKPLCVSAHKVQAH